MTAVILQGFNLRTSEATSSDALQASLDVSQSIVHAHFAMYNGVNKDGSWKPIPMWWPTQASSYPYYPLKLADDLRNRGQLLLLSWSTRNLVGPGGTSVGMTSADICGGKYDPYLHQCAKAVAAWKHPIVIALDPEMNWSGNVHFQPGPEFIATWRYIVGLFRADGATNVSWSWHANQVSNVGNSSTTAEDRLPEWWPGLEWVDLVGADVYNAAAGRGADWITFDQMMTGTGTTWLGDMWGALEKLAPNTPKVLGEFGCHNAPGDKSLWLRDAMAAIPARYGDIMIASYYGIDDGACKWSLRTDDGTARAYEDAIEEGPYVQGGQFAMPPDMQPLKPFSRTIMVGDPAVDLAAANRKNTALSTLLDLTVTDRDTAAAALVRAKSDLTDMSAARDAVQAALSACMTKRESLRAAWRELASQAQDAS